MVTVAWLLDFRKAIMSKWSCLVDPYLIDLDVDIGISEESRL